MSVERLCERFQTAHTFQFGLAAAVRLSKNALLNFGRPDGAVNFIAMKVIGKFHGGFIDGEVPIGSDRCVD